MADYNSKYSGEQIDALLDQVASGNAGGGGGGGITVEADPIFSASPASSITEEKVAEWNNKYTKPSGGIPQSDLAEEVIAALRKAEQYTGTVNEIKVNGNNIGASGGVVDLGNLVAVDTAGGLKIIDIQGFINDNLYALPNAANGDEDDILLSRDTVKTINGESIVGVGNITIAGGSGEKGDKGDKGDTGVGVQSVAQTTTSNADGGSNVVTVTLTDGTKSTFTVKNGSQGIQGIQGEQGPKGDKGDKGDTGTNGTNGTNGKDGADGEDGATFTPSVDSAGNLSWTNNKGLANPPTVNIKGPKGDKGDAGEGGGGSSGGGGVETISLSGGFGTPLIIEEMLAEKRYYLYVDGDADGNEQSIVIGGFEGDGVVDGVHIRHFYAVIDCVSNGSPFNVSLSLPDVDIHWSTGIPIPIRGVGRYELSITQVSEDGYAFYNAVLTSFSQL